MCFPTPLCVDETVYVFVLYLHGLEWEQREGLSTQSDVPVLKAFWPACIACVGLVFGCGISVVSVASIWK